MWYVLGTVAVYSVIRYQAAGGMKLRITSNEYWLMLVIRLIFSIVIGNRIFAASRCTQIMKLIETRQFSQAGSLMMPLMAFTKSLASEQSRDIKFLVLQLSCPDLRS